MEIIKAPVNESLNGYSNMKCSCGKVVTFDKSFESHFSNCSSFQLQFGELLNALINTIKKIKDKNDYNLIKYMFHVQKFQIRKVLKQVKTKENPYSLSTIISVPEHKYEEEKIRKTITSVKEVKSIPLVVVEEKSLIPCTGCKRQFPDMSNIIALSCGHDYCHNCMKFKVFKEFPETGQLFCYCRVTVKEIEIKVMLSKESSV